MNLKNLWQQEPVAIVNAVRLTALALMAFGLQITTSQLIAAMAALEVWLTLLTRANVHSTASVSQQLSDIQSANNKAGV